MTFGKLSEKASGRLVNTKFDSAGFTGISIDSRTVDSENLFVAIEGEYHDGHDFIEEAVRRKCSGIMVNSRYQKADLWREQVPVVIVPDTHQSLLELAGWYRQKLKAAFVAVTGSNGKTTIKEMIYSIIKSSQRKVYCSPGNLNNLYGLPLALLGMPDDSEYGVLELGISTPGEMTRLADIARPDLALIANVGPTHLEFLGSVEGVAEAKLELVDVIGDEKPVILNSDDEILMRTASRRARSFITFGIESEADFSATHRGISSDGFPILTIDNTDIEVKLFGEHQIYNLLASYAVCKTLGIKIKASDLNELDFKTGNYRGEIVSYDGLTIIADCYNANPISMKSGLRSFHSYWNQMEKKSHRSIAVIGDMLELGEKSEQYHREIGEYIGGLKFDFILTVGGLSAGMYDAAVKSGYSEKNIRYFADVDSAGEYLREMVQTGDLIYMKASRGIALEKLLSLLKESAVRQN
jgi:UDP-N-acetylmuramoyl-tripeptide--D-alanyl-D-alanine ligase